MLVLSILSTLLSSVAVTVVLMLKDQSNRTARLQKEFESRLRTLEFEQKRDVEKLGIEINMLRTELRKLPCSANFGEGEKNRYEKLSDIIRETMAQMMASRGNLTAAIINANNPAELAKWVKDLPIAVLEQLRDSLLENENFRAVAVISTELISRSTKSDPSV